MKLYSGIVLHSTNSHVAIIDESESSIRKLPNDIATITEKLSLYSGTLKGVVVESTYNWYWLVDGLTALPYIWQILQLSRKTAASRKRHGRQKGQHPRRVLFSDDWLRRQAVAH